MMGMNGVIKWVAVAALAVSTVGCVETLTYVTVKKDGSGTIKLRALFDEEAVKKVAGGAAGMMGQAMGEAMGDMMGEVVGGMASGMGDAVGAEGVDGEEIKAEIKSGFKEGFAEAPTETTMTMSGPESFYDEAQARKLAKAFGETVRFVSGKEIAHRDGRKGFEAIYAFDDVTTIGVSQEIGDIVIECSMDEGGEEDEEMHVMAEAYRFEFTEGHTATLNIKPLPSEEEMTQEWLAEASPEEVADYKEMLAEEGAYEAEDEDDSEMSPEMETQMAEQMLGAFKARRDTIMVSVEGTVTSCNATHRSRKRPNTLVLVHMDYDKLLSNPKGKDLLMNQDDYRLDFLKAASKTEIPGVLIEDPEKTVVVKFN